MDHKSIEIIYLGFLLPGLFSLTLAAEGLYKIYRHEEGFFTFILGLLFIVGLTIAYLVILRQ